MLLYLFLSFTWNLVCMDRGLCCLTFAIASSALRFSRKTSTHPITRPVRPKPYMDGRMDGSIVRSMDRWTGTYMNRKMNGVAYVCT